MAGNSLMLYFHLKSKPTMTLVTTLLLGTNNFVVCTGTDFQK